MEGGSSWARSTNLNSRMRARSFIVGKSAMALAVTVGVWACGSVTLVASRIQRSCARSRSLILVAVMWMIANPYSKIGRMNVRYN